MTHYTRQVITINPLLEQVLTMSKLKADNNFTVAQMLLFFYDRDCLEKG